MLNICAAIFSEKVTALNRCIRTAFLSKSYVNSNQIKLKTNNIFSSEEYEYFVFNIEWNFEKVFSWTFSTLYINAHISSLRFKRELLCVCMENINKL